MLHPVVAAFVLTVAVSFLIGIGLRGYYEAEGKFDTFGTARTFVFIGMLGFALYQLPGIGRWAYLLGFASLTLFLLVYYSSKVLQKKSPGLIGVMVGLITYTTGPVAIHEPTWYLVLLGISILFTVHSKGRIRKFTDRLKTGEIVTACKFLAIVGVVLPLIPATMPEAEGVLGLLLTTLPVTPRQIWMAVVITTGISYFGYVLQTYFFPRRGLLLTGIIGGIYSSTVTVLVLAKKARREPSRSMDAAVAILFAVSIMYLRLLVLIAIFRMRSSFIAMGPLLVLSLLLAAYAVVLRSRNRAADAADAPGEIANAPELQRNPLEINSAILFAVLFTAISFATKYVVSYGSSVGLRVLSFVVGFSDITPYVVSILQGNFGIDDAKIVQAILIASASNNLLKTAYTYIFGTRDTANAAAPAMIGVAIPTIIYALVVL